MGALDHVRPKDYGSMLRACFVFRVWIDQPSTFMVTAWRGAMSSIFGAHTHHKHRRERSRLTVQALEMILVW